MDKTCKNTTRRFIIIKAGGAEGLQRPGQRDVRVNFIVKTFANNRFANKSLFALYIVLL